MKNERRAGLFGPLLLISAGLIFLLNSLGVVEWSIWRSLLSLWPILLIGAGLDLLIGRRSTLGALLVAAVVLALLFGGAWYLMQPSPSAAASHTISQALAGATRADVEIRAGTGRLRLGPTAEAGQLIEGTVMLRPNQNLEESFNSTGDLATYRLGIAGPNAILAPAPGRNQAEQWHLNLSQDAGLDLKLSLGMGDAVADLSRLELSQLAFHIGVGEAALTFPDQGRFEAKVDGGVGKIVLRIPEGMAARIQADSGIGSTDVDAEFQRQGDVYITPGFETAAKRVDLEVDIGLGSIVIESYRGS